MIEECEKGCKVRRIVCSEHYRANFLVIPILFFPVELIGGQYYSSLPKWLQHISQGAQSNNLRTVCYFYP